MEQIGDSLRQAQMSRTNTSRFVKQLLFGIIATSLLVLDWWLLKESLFGGRPASFWIWPSVVTALWVTAVSFFALVNSDRIMFFTFNVIGLISYLILMPRDIYVFLGGIIFFLLSMLFQRRIQDEEKNQLNFSIRRTLSNAQSVIIYALLILIGFLVYSNLNDDFNRNRDEFYNRLSQAVVKGVPFLAQDRSQYNLGQTVEEFFRKQAEEEFPQFNQVSREQQELLMDQIRFNFEQQFGIEANQNETLRVAFTQVITQRLREALGGYERFFPLMFTILIVALMRTFSFVFSWVVLILSWLVYRFLRIVRFFRIGKTTIEVEKLEI